MFKRTFTTLANKLKQDSNIVNFYKNIFVTHDHINKYMIVSAGMICGGYVYIRQEIKDEITDIKSEIKDLKSDIKDIKNLLISKT
jgi:hypothetical protein